MCYCCGCMQFKNVGEKMEDTKMEKVRAEASEGSTFP